MTATQTLWRISSADEPSATKNPARSRARGVSQGGVSPHHSPVFANHDAGLDRQLHGGKAQGLECHAFADAVDLEHHAPGLDLADPAIDRALALAHADLDRLGRHRHVRENPDPDPALALHVARHGAARGLDLTRGHTLGLRGLEPVAAEVEIRAALGLALDAALELLAEFRALRLKHLSFLLSDGRRRHGGRGHPAVPGPCDRGHSGRAP